MSDYIITEKAGRFVAGMRNPGAGVTIKLSDRQAAHDLRVGALRRAGEPALGASAPEAREPLTVEQLEAMTVAELRELADGIGVDLERGDLKADIVARISGSFQG